MSGRIQELTRRKQGRGHARKQGSENEADYKKLRELKSKHIRE